MDNFDRERMTLSNTKEGFRQACKSHHSAAKGVEDVREHGENPDVAFVKPFDALVMVDYSLEITLLERLFGAGHCEGTRNPWAFRYRVFEDVIGP